MTAQSSSPLPTPPSAPRRSPHSLRASLILVFMGALAVLLFLGGWFEYRWAVDESLQARRAQMARQLEALARHALHAGEGASSLQDEFAYLSTQLELQALVLVDADGQVLAASRREWLGRAAAGQVPGFTPEIRQAYAQPSRPQQILDASGSRLLAWQAYDLPVPPGQLRAGQGLLFMSMDVSAGRAAIAAAVVRRELISWGLAALFLLTLYVWLTRQVVRPLQQLRQHIASFDPSGPEVGQVPDFSAVAQVPYFSAVAEVSDLALAFAAMQNELTATWRAIPDLIFELDGEGRYLRASNSRPDLLAVPKETLIGRSVVDVLPPAAALEVLQALQEAAMAGSVYGRQFQLALPGGRRWFEISVARKAAAGQAAPSFIVLSRDITGRKVAEQTRQEALDRVQKLASRLPGVVYQYRMRVDGSTAFTYVSDAAQEIFHVSAEVLLIDASAVLRLVHPDDQDSLHATLQKSARDLTAWRREFRLRLPDGTVRWLFGNAMPQREPDGSTLWHGFTSDITDLKQARDRQRMAERIFDASREGITLTDAAGRIELVNPAFTQITGYSAEDAQGKTPNILSSGRHGREFYQAMWAALKDHDHWSGEIWNRRKDGRLLPEWLSVSAIRDEAGMVSNYVGVFSDLTELKASEARVDELAWRNPLTALPNRAFLLARLHEATQAPGRFALLLINLRGFQRINASFGIEAGDSVLHEAGRRIKQAAAGHLLCHLEGDEFAVFLNSGAGQTQAAALADSLQAQLAQPYLFAALDETAHLGAAIGIALYPDNGREVGTLMQQADAALKEARREEHSTYRFANAELTESARFRLNMEGRLRRAIVEQQLCVFYQPQLDVRHNRLIGAEALVRWRDPQGGLVPPGQFIPLAEESGLIVDIGFWVLEDTCRQGAAWIDSGYPPLPLAVNVAARQLKAGDFVARVEAILARTGFPAHLLDLELTESTLMDGGEALLACFAQLRQLGVGLSIDDFGTGYSSLAYLQRFPVSKLKIDKTFVDHLATRAEDRRIVAAVVSLGHALKLDVLAEGVESADQLEWLERLGCDSWQGFLHSKPVSAEDFAVNVFAAPPVSLRSVQP